MKKFINNIKRYFKYAIYSAKSELKAEVANSYLNWLWWILDPVCFMIIYTFIVQIVFSTNEPHLPVFVFIGLTAWNYFNKMTNSSVKIVNANKQIVTKVYIPKYILLIQKSFVELFKMMISFVLVLILMFFFNVPYTLHILWALPITAVLYVITFGVGSILLHFGIFIEDLSNVTNIFLKLVFYLSGIFYNIKTRVKGVYGVILLRCNPIAFIMDQYRIVIIEGKMPAFDWLAIWLCIGLLLCIIGISIVHKYENSYAKVI